MSIHFFYQMTLITALCSNTALAILLVRKTDRSATTISFVIFIMLVNIWAAPYIVLNSPHRLDASVYETLSKVASLGYTLFPSVFLIFGLCFTNRKRLLSSVVVWASLIISALEFLYLNWATDLIKLHSQEDAIRSEWGITTPNGPYFSYFILWFEIQVILSLALIFRQYLRTKDPVFKRQNLLIFLAVSVPLLAGSISDAFLPIMQIYVFPLAIPMSTTTAVICAIALLKYGLFHVAPLQILTNIGEGILSIDQEGRVAMSNKTAQLMLRLNEREILGKTYESLFVIEDENAPPASSSQRPLSLIVANSKPIIKTQVNLVRHDQSKLPIHMIITPIKHIGKTIGATIVMRDMTSEIEEQKQRESFLNFAGHEIKTPFASIKLYTSILEKHITNGNTDQALTYVHKVHNQVEKLNKMIDQLSDLTVIQTKQLELTLEECLIGEIIENASVEIKNMYPERVITVHGNKDIYITGDKIRLEQVLINLLSNAVKYSPSSSEITVKIEQSSQDVLIHVIDKGRGIDTRYKENIFQSFFRIDDPELKNISGMGIGLYLVKRIISLHKGNVWVQSEIGKGSEFIISLPRTIEI